MPENVARLFCEGCGFEWDCEAIPEGRDWIPAWRSDLFCTACPGEVEGLAAERPTFVGAS